MPHTQTHSVYQNADTGHYIWIKSFGPLRTKSYHRLESLIYYYQPYTDPLKSKLLDSVLELNMSGLGATQTDRPLKFTTPTCLTYCSRTSPTRVMFWTRKRRMMTSSSAVLDRSSTVIGPNCCSPGSGQYWRQGWWEETHTNTLAWGRTNHCVSSHWWRNPLTRYPGIDSRDD